MTIWYPRRRTRKRIVDEHSKIFFKKIMFIEIVQGRPFLNPVIVHTKKRKKYGENVIKEDKKMYFKQFCHFLKKKKKSKIT